MPRMMAKYNTIILPCLRPTSSCMCYSSGKSCQLARFLDKAILFSGERASCMDYILRRIKALDFKVQKTMLETCLLTSTRIRNLTYFKKVFRSSVINSKAIIVTISWMFMFDIYFTIQGDISIDERADEILKAELVFFTF